MRHHNANRKFGRETNQRRALLRLLSESLMERGKIKTTLPKAKEVRSFIEPIITKGKNATLSSRRNIISRLGTQKRATILINSVAPKYKDRAGGYTRIVKLGRRKSDGSTMAIIELV